MDFAEALKITNACAMHVGYKQGWGGKPPSLEQYTLAQLLEANHMVAEHGEELHEDGSRTLYCFCDDRLVAALYVAYHYDADECEEDQWFASIAVTADGRGVVVMMATADDEDDEE